MKTGFLFCVFLVCSNIMAAEHSLGAHEHGSVKLAVAVEKNSMDLDLDGPSESFIGFEHAPKSAKEIKLFNDTKELWEKKLLSVIVPNVSLGCKISEASFKQEIEGAHADVEAKAKITCVKNLAGSDLQIAMIKTFPKIKKLKVEVLSTNTTSVEITKPVQNVKL